MRAWAWGLVTFAAAGAGWAQPYQRTIAQTSGETLICVTWSTRELTWTVDAAGSARTPGDTEFTAVDAAWSSWQALADGCSDFRFTRGPRLANAPTGKDTETSNVLVWREVSCRDAAGPADPCQADGSCANRYRCWDHSDATIALTTSTYSTRTGVVYDSDIEFNASPHADGTSFLFTTVASPPCAPGLEAPTCAAYDVQNTATHEIGHVVGFDHVEVPTSTMAATAPVGEISKRLIDSGTVEGFCATYPRGQPPLPCDDRALLSWRITARSAGSFGIACGAAPAQSGLFYGLLLLLLRRR